MAIERRYRWIGRGLDDIPGRPFGYAWNREQDEIREHLKRRGRWGTSRDTFIVSRIQARLHKNRPTYAERCAARAAAQPAPTGGNCFLTWEEAERLVEYFAGANDPITASIAAKAQKILEERE